MNDKAFLAIFPFLFIGVWLLSTTLMAVFSGWTTLAQHFPDRDDRPLKVLRFQSARLGKGGRWNPWGGVSYGSCLRFDICAGGLRVKIWRIFGPFSRPFFVPWDKISVEEQRIFFFRTYRLAFGSSDLSALTIYRRSFKKIESSGLLKSGTFA